MSRKRYKAQGYNWSSISVVSMRFLSFSTYPQSQRRNFFFSCYVVKDKWDFFDIKHTIKAETSELKVLQCRGQLISCISQTQFAVRECKKGVSVHESLHFSLLQTSVTCFQKTTILNSLTPVLLQMWHNIIKWEFHADIIYTTEVINFH